MNGERFSVGLKDVTSLEKFIQIKSLLKEEINIDKNVKDTVDNDENIEHLLQDIHFMNCSTEKVALSEDSREVTCHRTGYIIKKAKKRYGSCCNQLLIASPVTSESVEYPYIEILSIGRLTFPSLNLADCVGTAFAILYFSYGAISKYGLPSRFAAEAVLKHVFNSFQTFTCEAHESAGQIFTIANSTIGNIYLKIQRKISTNAVVADRVRSFKKDKKSKYEKQSITNNHFFFFFFNFIFLYFLFFNSSSSCSSCFDLP